MSNLFKLRHNSIEPILATKEKEQHYSSAKLRHKLLKKKPVPKLKVMRTPVRGAHLGEISGRPTHINHHNHDLVVQARQSPVPQRN